MTSRRGIYSVTPGGRLEDLAGLAPRRSIARASAEVRPLEPLAVALLLVIDAEATSDEAPATARPAETTRTRIPKGRDAIREQAGRLAVRLSGTPWKPAPGIGCATDAGTRARGDDVSMPGFKRFRLPRLWGRRPARLELIEDALKHVHAALERGQQATVESLAGALGISSARAAELIRDLHVRGLVATEEGLTLTPAGQKWARTVVRAHRLLERYLADELRVPPVALHRLADQKEHRLDRAEVERLAARLGYPQRDPHGDPIPTAEGELATLAAIPVTLAPPREPLRIVHVEDEPEAVYARLAALDLEPDRVLVVLDFSPERLILDIEGVQRELRPVDAANIFVAPAPAGAPGPTASLADLELGEAARVKALRVSGLARRRLLDLGFTRGARVECALRSPSGEPKAYRIRGTLVALRSGQARRIEIEREEATPEP